ncbi:hypothetical protein GCK72_023488 [Caenorhabditis remanei]|uniref:C2H2-type domain-containing protein n=1 Tax=Caenorhabditis remanei TaxID=31234 RepID=E3MME2_CAERE|nr:hypothetical protein GCK72_023488 [Caenorhabditis remanei]EFP05019.1 hypothetical protein CRE_03278 [Caenorhabditis remanei]KAF1747030.1 hypothetical protein GCK72_023488 [Caenorhabditis remanei]
MEIVPNPEKSYGPTGHSSTIKRNHSMVAQHKTFGLKDFIFALADNHDDLQVATLTEEYEDPERHLEMVVLKCPRCNKDAENTRDLIGHLVTHESKRIQCIYAECGVVNIEVNEQLKYATNMQAKNSIFKRKIENRPYTLNVALSSPLFPFLSMRKLKIYMDQPPYATKSSANSDLIQKDLVRGDNIHPLFFDWFGIQKVYEKIKACKKLKQEKHDMRYLKSLCEEGQVIYQDLVHKNRTKEETMCLASALNLPIDFTQQQLVDAMRMMADYKADRPDSSISYNALEDEDGNAITKEQRKLISTLSSNFIFITGSKRRCTKNKSYKFDV